MPAVGILTHMKFENAGSRFLYSVADTESGPVIEILDSGTVALRFTDYKCQAVSLLFDDVLGIKYQSSALDVSGWAEDCAIEVIDSEWLRETCLAEKEDPSGFRHLIIGFNERGMVLEILFARLAEANKAVNPSGGPGVF